MTELTARGIRKSFGRNTVLAGIDLELARGEVVGLIGRNGAGKTTLMSCLLGFLRPDEGTIAFGGRANDDLEVRRQTGFVPERMNIGRRETGWQFLRYMARLAMVPRAEVDSRADAMLERLGLTQARHRRLAEYSRGMLQRIALCQALIHKPAYVFLDEPTSGLDPAGVLLVRDLITEQKQRGATILLNSHQLGEVEKICDRVYFLDKGVIARTETLRHTDRIVVAIRLLPGSYDVSAVQRVTLRQPENDIVIAAGESDADIAKIVQQLVASGAGVVEVKPHTADLEGIFRGTE